MNLPKDWEPKLPHKHSCGRVSKNIFGFLQTHRFDGPQQAAPTSRQDYYSFTCKNCGSSFILEAGKKFTEKELKKFFKPTTNE